VTLGITLPLTFSFIDAMYAGVYRQMCRALGLRETYLARHRNYFQMLGYYHGRVYYNLLNWYRLLTLLPGARYHRRHFNEMLGIGEQIGEAELPPTGPVDLLRMVLAVVRLTWRFLLLPAHIRRFLARLRAVRKQADSVDLDALRLPELVEHYYQLEHLLLRHWVTPQFNDFYCQTTTGLLKSAISRWLGEQHLALMHELLPVDESVESETAILSLQDLATAIRNHTELLETCRHGLARDLLPKLRADPVISARFDDHIKRFGDRWQGELKLETVTPADNPQVLLDVLRNHVLALSTTRSGPGKSALHWTISQLPLVQRLTLRTLAGLSRVLIANRENTRFERTRVFGLVRRIFRAIGRRLAERGHFSAADDIFYLTKDEVFDLIQGTAADAQPGSTVRERRAAIEIWRSQPALGRFRTQGLLAEYRAATGAQRTTMTGRVLTGTGASPGIVRSRVRLINSPGDLGEASGCIIVAESTDPGWSFIFPLISGILVERGSMLSHAAIVAREMNIPAIVGIEGLMQGLHDNALVEIDGATGIVTVLDEANETER